MPSTKYGLGKNRRGIELTLPSREDPENSNSPHNKCLVRMLDPSLLMQHGILDSLDSLGGLVAGHFSQVESGKPNDLAELTPEKVRGMSELEVLRYLRENQATITSGLSFIDRIVELAVIEPKVRRAVRMEEGKEIPLNDLERERAESSAVEPFVWVEDVDGEDKTAILQFVLSGVRAAEPFRAGQTADVPDMEPGKDVQLPTE